MRTNQSPFKFLDAYQYEDYSAFFGRKEEVDDLYHALRGVKHLLVYGPTGAGKTSLIECGLRNQYSKADWFALTIRRGANLPKSFFEQINSHLDEPVSLDVNSGWPKDKAIGFAQMSEYLFEEKSTPVYFLFDQFEELLLLGDKEEQISFFQELNKLVHHRLPCRILLVMREEFIGHLSAFETYLPDVFRHRYRLEKMNRLKVREVIQQVLQVPAYQQAYALQESEVLVDEILTRLPDDKQEIELTYVQVFLNELFERALKKSTGQLPVLSKQLIEQGDDLEGVLNNFLNEQLHELNTQYPENLPLETLATMISERYTKLQITATDITADLHKNNINGIKQLPSLLDDFERRRLIRASKSGDVTRFEISHDLLALAVGENLSEEIRLRQKADKIYRVYQEREGFYSRDDIAYLATFEPYKEFPTPIQNHIDASKKHLQQVEQAAVQSAQKRTRIAVGLLGLTAIGLVSALVFYFQAERQRDIVADKNYDLQWQMANTHKIGGEYTAAQTLLNGLAIEIESHTERDRIKDTIQVWHKVDSLTQLAIQNEVQRSQPTAVQLVTQAMILSNDGHLQGLLQQYKQTQYDRMIEDAQTLDAFGKTIEIGQLIEAIIALEHKSEEEVWTDIRGER